MYDCLDGKSSIGQRKDGAKPSTLSSVRKMSLCLKHLLWKGKDSPKGSKLVKQSA